MIERLSALKEVQTDSIVISQLEILILQYQNTTPDFNKENQYFKYGNIDIIEEGHYFNCNSPYAIAGESGTSWINSAYYFAGIESVWSDNVASYCNNKN